MKSEYKMYHVMVLSLSLSLKMRSCCLHVFYTERKGDDELLVPEFSEPDLSLSHRCAQIIFHIHTLEL